MYSFGKTLHITGWRVGYCVAPAVLTRELRKVHQFNAFSIARRCRHAIALYLQRHPDAWRQVAAFFSAKRDLLLARAGGQRPRRCRRPQGTYFQLADYGALGRLQRRRIHRAPASTRPASRSIPLSPFYREPPPGMRIVRLCVAKRDDDADRGRGAHPRVHCARCRGRHMNFRVSIVQQPLVWQDAAANRAHFAKVLAPLAGTTDLVVLPEMFTTGFTMKPEAHAEPADGETRAWLLDAGAGARCRRRRQRRGAAITAATSTASCSRRPMA